MKETDQNEPIQSTCAGMNLQKAYTYLSDVGDRNRVIPFRRFAGGVGRTGQAKEFKATQGASAEALIHWTCESNHIIVVAQVVGPKSPSSSSLAS